MIDLVGDQLVEKKRRPDPAFAGASSLLGQALCWPDDAGFSKVSSLMGRF